MRAKFDIKSRKYSGTPARKVKAQVLPFQTATKIPEKKMKLRILSLKMKIPKLKKNRIQMVKKILILIICIKIWILVEI